ncbi:MAG TPA: LON peptidase substrate-binding domain-containing protein [Planctomycetota bacterium]|jgi:hypothetical protein
MNPLSSDYAGPVPIFPLPTVVLFPHTVVPLHIYETRYRAMVEDALKGDRLIAMALLRPGWEKDYEGAPPVHDILGVGRILRDERIEDGRFNILLHGLARARIEELFPPAPYRRARIRILPEPAETVSPRLERVRLGLLAVYSSVLNSGSAGPIQIEPNLSLGTLCDRLAAILEVEVGQKQAVLEELEPSARAARTIELIRRSPLAGQPVESGLRNIAKRAWPPDSSTN